MLLLYSEFSVLIITYVNFETGLERKSLTFIDLHYIIRFTLHRFFFCDSFSRNGIPSL